MVNRSRVIIAASVIFLTGAATGAFVVRTYAPKIIHKTHVAPPLPLSDQRRQEYLGKLEKELALTPEQHAKIETILAESQQRMKMLWGTIEPQTKEEYRRTRREISELLDPGQRERMKQMHRKGSDKQKSGADDKNTRRPEACAQSANCKKC